jgi:8-oxo-dGTP diphosphatase
MSGQHETCESVDVVCALIVEEGRVLTVRYGPLSKHPGKWEFPGGKVHPGESPEDALLREIREELEVEVTIMEKLENAEYTYPERSIRLIPFVSAIRSGKLKLKEHDAFLWASQEALLLLDLLPADRLLLGSGQNFKRLKHFLAY